MNSPLWVPSDTQRATSRMTSFIDLIKTKYGVAMPGYDALHTWSVDHAEQFWSELWDYAEVVSSVKGSRILVDGQKFPGARWFPDSKLNYAENMLRFRDDRVALISLMEDGSRKQVTYAELFAQVSKLVVALKDDGVSENDRVAGIMSNTIETVVAMLATTSIGAVWSSCSPDFGFGGLMDRIGQIKPKVLFCTNGYHYNDKQFDSIGRAILIADQVSSIERVVVVPQLKESLNTNLIPKAILYCDYIDRPESTIAFPQLPFDHPLVIMFSSGTTGKPKCIVHGAGGTLLQHLKEHQLMVDLRREDVFFFYSTCGWMMWNWLVSGLGTGATLVLYDGAPSVGNRQVLLDAIDEEGISVFGIGAKYISGLQKNGIRPTESHDLGTLKVALSTGSPLLHENFEYVYGSMKQDIRLSSISGGTDILSCFVGGCPLLPVYSGEIQAKGLGMAVEIWNDEGESVLGEKGELVCVQPFPSTPLGFLDDIDGKKYHGAYFSRWSNIWSHGDYGEIMPTGGMVIYGRSDAVLNPGGVRIGTAEIYRQVEVLESIAESVVVAQEQEDDVRIVLFIVLKPGHVLDEDFRKKIKTVIRQGASPRHVPEKIVAVADIPRTLSGKIVELAVREVIHGRPVKNLDALANPEALEYFRDIVELKY